MTREQKRANKDSEIPHKLLERLSSLKTDTEISAALETLGKIRDRLKERQLGFSKGVRLTNTGDTKLILDFGMECKPLSPRKSYTVVPDVAESSLFKEKKEESHLTLYPTYPARLVCFDIVNDTKEKAKITLDVTGVDPRFQKGMTVVVQYLSGEKARAFMHITEKTSLELDGSERVRVIGLGFDINAAYYIKGLMGQKWLSPLNEKE